MNPFARFAQQAEVNLGDLSRRAIDSVTLPIRLKSQEMMGEVTRAVSSTVKGLLIKAVLGLFAAIMAIIALVYALGALHTVLTQHFGPVDAALMMAGIFLLLAILGVIALVAWPKPASSSLASVTQARRDAETVMARARQQASAAELKMDTVSAAADPRGAGSEGQLDMGAGLGVIAAALGEAGFKREQAGLRAGMALAEQLKPMQLVSLALIGGFVAGIRLTRRR